MNPQVFYTMQQQEENFLNLANYPARMSAEQAGWFLGFSLAEITILMGEGY